MRATIENHEASRILPPIKVMIALGGEDLSIKVSLKSLLSLSYQFQYWQQTLPLCTNLSVGWGIGIFVEVNQNM